MLLRRATIADLWEHALAKPVPFLENAYCELMSETLRGNVWAGVEQGEVIAIGGVKAGCSDGPGLCWLSVGAGLSVSLIPAVLLMRRVLRTADEGAGLVCCVSLDNREGQRLAAALGFEPTPRTLLSIREWRYARGRHRRHDHGQVLAAGREGAATAAGPAE